MSTRRLRPTRRCGSARARPADPSGTARPTIRRHEPHPHRRNRLVHDGETADRRAAPGRADRRRLVRQRDAQPVSICSASRMEFLGRLGLRRRRRHRRLEVEAEVQLPDRRRGDADRRRPGVRSATWAAISMPSTPRPARSSGVRRSAARSAAASSPIAPAGGEKIAVTTGLTGVAWPTEVVTGKIVVLGLDGDPAKPEARRPSLASARAR